MSDEVRKDKNGASPGNGNASPSGAAATRWWNVATAGLFAVLAFVAIDRLAARLVPPHHISEVADGVAALEAGAPTTLVLGSSHARTFEAVDRELARRTGGRERIVAVPIEYGKLTSYEWVVNHRLLPLIDARRHAAPGRPALARFILISEWWDSCAPVDGQFPPNVPARAWRFADFAADVSQHGLTDYNRSYLAEQWRQLFRSSALMQDRGYARLWDSLRTKLGRPIPAEVQQAEFEADIASWRRTVEAGERCLGDPVQMAAFSRILDSLAARRLEVTLLLYPRKPATLTDRAKATTLARWARIASDTAAAHGARVIDLTSTSPLTDAQFARDFDHVTPEGNEFFARWALDGPFAFLAAAPGTTEAAR